MKKKKSAQIHTDAKGLFLIAVGFLGLVALLSFNIHHMSSNWLGFLGYAAALGTQYLFGLGGFLIPCYLLWWGYRLLSSQKHSAADHLYFLIFLGSLSILFNVFAETLPDRAAGFASKVFTETIFLPSPYPRTIVRYNLGGVPFYFLFRDLPFANLQHILSTVGTTLIFSMLSLVSFLLLTKVRIFTNLRMLSRAIVLLIKSAIDALEKKSPAPMAPPVYTDAPKPLEKISLPPRKALFGKIGKKNCRDSQSGKKTEARKRKAAGPRLFAGQI